MNNHDCSLAVHRCRTSLSSVNCNYKCTYSNNNYSDFLFSKIKLLNEYENKYKQNAVKQHNGVTSSVTPVTFTFTVDINLVLQVVIRHTVIVVHVKETDD